MIGRIGGALSVVIAAAAGAWAGFALMFYGYLLFHPPTTTPGGDVGSSRRVASTSRASWSCSACP